MSRSAFAFPDAYHYPPFFTLQEVLVTRQKQTLLWTDLIINYFRFHNMHREELKHILESDLCCNRKIQRQLNGETFSFFIDEMVNNGSAEWEDTSRTRFYVYWRKLEDWARFIYEWIGTNGMLDTPFTLYELYAGDIARGTDLFNLHPVVLKKSLHVLAQQQKAILIMGKTDDEMGVKFK
jgi:ESCRT-II complex subunit VPS25